jgi:hypothetical protein
VKRVRQEKNGTEPPVPKDTRRVTGAGWDRQHCVNAIDQREERRNRGTRRNHDDAAGQPPSYVRDGGDRHHCVTEPVRREDGEALRECARHGSVRRAYHDGHCVGGPRFDLARAVVKYRVNG